MPKPRHAAQKRRYPYIVPIAVVLGALVWLKAARWALPARGSGEPTVAARILAAHAHRSNSEWAANFAGSSTTVALLPDGDAAAGADARATLLSLNERFQRGASAMEKRMAALDAVLQSDNTVRRAWNTRLAAAAPRGIAVTAGGATALANAFAVIHTLKHIHKTALPITVVHVGPDEIDPGAAAAFKTHLPDIPFFDLLAPGVYPDHHIPIKESLEPLSDPKAVGYAAKVAALYAAPYREVLLLDADSLPLSDPAELFSTEAYEKHGAVFWPDFWEGRPELWSVLGLGGSEADPWAAAARGQAAHGHDGGGTSFRQTESGQILLDKARHWKMLEWLLFLSTHAHVTYGPPLANTVGEKDLYAPAFALAGTYDQFWQVPFPPALPAVDRWRGRQGAKPEPRFAFAGMIQAHPDTGTPFFFHRTAESKLPARGAIGLDAGAPTHISPPASQAQAGKMTAWRGSIPAWLFRLWRPSWGLWSKEVKIVRCRRPGEGFSISGSGGSEDAEGAEGRRREGRACPACSETLKDLGRVDEVCVCCGGRKRTLEDKARVPLPVTMVDVGPLAALGTVAAAALDAHALFIEFRD